MTLGGIIHPVWRHISCGGRYLAQEEHSKLFFYLREKTRNSHRMGRLATYDYIPSSSVINTPSPLLCFSSLSDKGTV